MIDLNTVKMRMTERKITVNLGDAARSLRISFRSIAQVLRDGGFAISINNPNARLTSKQIDFLAIAYVSSVKAYFKRQIASIQDMTPNEFSRLKGHLEGFIQNSEGLLTEELITAELDSELIAELFYDLINAASYKTAKIKPIYDVLFEIKFETSLNQINKELATQVVELSTHNHVYPNEEDDNNRFANNSICFSFVSKTLLRSFTNNINFLKQLKWKTNMFSLKI